MAFSSDQIWASFYNNLVKYAVPNFDSSTQAVSIAGTTLYVDIANANPKVNNASIYNIGNLLPAAGPSYVPKGDLITSYALFLDWIKLQGDTNPNLQAQINSAGGDVSEAQDNFNTQQGKAYTQFGDYKKNINPNAEFDTWVNTNFPVYLSAKSALDAATSRYQALMTQAYGPGYQTLQAAENAVSFITGARSLSMKNAYNMAVAVGTVQPDGTNKVLPGVTPPAAESTLTDTFRPAYNMGGGFNSTYKTWQQASVDKNYPTSFTITGSSENTSYENSGWAEDVEASYRSWFSVQVAQQASYDKVITNWDASDFECTISFNGVGQFPISGDANWLMTGLLQNYKDSLKNGHPDLFGEGGSLHVIPSAAILGFGPKISIKLSNANYSTFKSTFEQSASVSIGVGPFSFGGSESSYDRQSSFHFDDDSTSIEITPPPTTVPVLLGVVNNKY